jgi:nicotinamide riboside kinase
MQAQIALGQLQDMPLRDFLARFAPRSAEPIPEEWLDMPLHDFRIIPVKLGNAAETPTPSDSLRATLDRIHTEEEAHIAPSANQSRTSSPEPSPSVSDIFPAAITDSEAVARAYQEEIQKIGLYLTSNLSVLVVCDKVLAEHIYRHAVRQSNKRPLLEGDPHTEGENGSSSAILQREVSGQSARIAALGRLLASIKADQVLVLRHLDMLAGGSPEGTLSQEARLLTEVLYRSQEFTPTLLGFADASVTLPRVLTDRFAVRIELAGLNRSSIPLLVTRSEYARFATFDQETLFKNVSGFNAIQLRNAMRYLCASSAPDTPVPRLMNLLREFKRGSSEEVEIPTVTFDQIGGYAQVKDELFDAIELITGKRPAFNPDGSSYEAPPDEPATESEADREQRRKLAPRGFIFHGPPGTGKTLFARAIANAMNATIQMVSGPEIMDMWVGKSESNLRRLFAVARRNAPAVIFFDEFDSIAAQRSGFTDGGSRASNAVVAQLLTEMDGFRTDQDILVIGTTNRLDIIDDALMRPSRFQPIQIDLPDQQARRQIATIHAQSFAVHLSEPDLLDWIADQTRGFNGDEIRAVFQQVARDMRKTGQQPTREAFGIEIDHIRRRREERLTGHVSHPLRSM